MSPRESERDRVRRVLAEKYGPEMVSEEMVEETIQALAREQRMGPTLLQAVEAAGKAIAAGPDGLSDRELHEALKDVAQDYRRAEVRRARLVAAAGRRKWSLREIAPLLGVSHGTVANILKAAADEQPGTPPPG